MTTTTRTIRNMKRLLSIAAIVSALVSPALAMDFTVDRSGDQFVVTGTSGNFLGMCVSGGACISTTIRSGGGSSTYTVLRKPETEAAWIARCGARKVPGAHSYSPPRWVFDNPACRS